MTQQKREKSAVSAGKQAIGSKLSRSEILTVRLDPKLRFAAELAARKHRRTLSSFTEWAVEEAVKRLPLSIHVIRGKKELENPSIPEGMPVGECMKYARVLNLGPWAFRKRSALDIVEDVWHPDESRRFAQLAMNYPELLTHDEEVLWKLILETPAVWHHNKRRRRTAIRYPDLNRRWDELKRIARGEAA